MYSKWLQRTGDPGQAFHNLQGHQTIHVPVEWPEVHLFDDDIPPLSFTVWLVFKKEMVASKMMGWHVNMRDCMFARWYWSIFTQGTVGKAIFIIFSSMRLLHPAMRCL